jgi:hypothetical protein
MRSPILSLTALAVLTTATAAAAQSAGPAPADAPPVSTASSDLTAAQINAWVADPSPVRGVAPAEGADGGLSSGVASADLVPGVAPPRDRAPHGVVGASIGSGGYRSAYGVVNMPLGASSDVTVAVSNEHLGNGNRSYGYGGYGYGRGYGGGYGGDRRSLGIALNLNGLGGGGSPDCGPGGAPPRWGVALPTDAGLIDRCRRAPGDASRR